MLTLEYYGYDADEKTDSMREQLKSVPKKYWDDNGDYFTFYEIRRIRASGSFKTIEFEDDTFVVIESDNYEMM